MLYVLLSMLLALSTQNVCAQRTKTMKPHEKNPPITIWIHGTKGTSTHFPIEPFRRLFECHPGLNLATTLKRTWHLRDIAEILCMAHPHTFCLDTFYLFGWSGRLNFQARREAAQELHDALLLLIADYTAHWGVKPVIRIITHSHGGNVVLNLALHDTGDAHPYIIDELILLACPVQDSTAPFVKSRLFKRVYSLYSKVDLFQVLDPQKTTTKKLLYLFFSPSL